MADLGRWFKLWCSSVHDPSLDNLDIPDFGRWAKLGAIIKEQGIDGTITLTSPARAVCSALQVSDFDSLSSAISRLPNVLMRREETPVSPETNLIVTYVNWAKYQGDYSTHRVRKLREMKRSKRRGEERRREEKRGENTPIVPKGDEPFDRFWKAYPKKVGKLAAKNAWLKAKINGSLENVLAAVETQKKSPQWQKDGGQYIPNPATWLKQGRWQDEPQPTDETPEWRRKFLAGDES